MLYAKEKGFPLYSYASNHPDKYYKLSDDAAEDAFLRYYFKKDFGEFPRADELDWDEHFYFNEEYREDPVAISIVERLGDKASGRYSNLKVVDIPDGMKYVIDDYDGVETLREDGPTW